ncbi:MAG: putative LPS assembly protein LptD, partial [Gemmatimonadaceae bacterium]
FNGAWQYRWLDRFLSGGLRTSHHAQRDGSTNTSVSWNHAQSFSQSTSLNTNINYMTNTTVQRTTTFDPRQVLATIRSNANYQTQFGQTRLSVGGSRTQYPGRKQVSQSLPNLSISSPTIAVTPWFDWTPSFDLQNSQELHIDQQGEFAYQYFNGLDGTPDSVLRNRSLRISSANFSTPIKIGGFSLTTTFRASDTDQNYPSTVVFVDPADTSKRINRVFERTFKTEFDWRSNFSLPSIGQGSLNLVPSLSFENVDPGPYWVRTQLSGGRFVHQSKRARAGLSASPTLFALFPGFGSVSRFRHAITPGLSYSYAPKGNVSAEYLRARNDDPARYLGANAQNVVSLSLSHVLEAKLRMRDTSSTVEPKKIKVLAMNFSSLGYDFERARQTGRSGFATDQFSYDLTTDLLPSFRGSVGYSLYEGSILSDSARFKPYRERIDASFTVNSQSGIFAALNRVFGRAVPQGEPSMERVGPSADDAQANAVASTPSAGANVRNRQPGVPATQGWQAQFTFSSQRQRPPTGSGIVIENDPARQCEPFLINPIQYDACIEEQSLRPTGGVPYPGTTAGGAFIRTPSRDNLQSQMSFNITPMWSGSWGTNYDFAARKFGSHAVTLQRKLHDWNAVFSFNQAANGNFAFSFFIALNAQPDLKFNYDKQTYRPVTR